jgi:hypothetical protein
MQSVTSIQRCYLSNESIISIKIIVVDNNRE